ncbi:hypothetical protein TNCV_2078981 [Trichonephila clavipes]|nr:hypothetical protein TNCV_2078981 [Trichonephila clavipes]
MSSRHHIDDFMRGRIIGKIEEGRKITDVAREFDIAHSVVSRLWKSFKTTGMCSRRHGEIVLEVRHLRKTGKQISRKTVARRLRGGGLYARRPVVCVPLTRQHRTARLQWCREHHNSIEQDWACVLFSDESRFSLSSDCRCQLIWRESGTAYRPENIQEKNRYPTCSIMVWAGIMINGRTRLHVVANGTMTGQRYIDEVLFPHVRLFRGAIGDKFVLWTTTQHVIEHSLQVAGRNYPPTNKNTLIRALTEEWDKLPQQLLDNVVQMENPIVTSSGYMAYLGATNVTSTGNIIRPSVKKLNLDRPSRSKPKRDDSNVSFDESFHSDVSLWPLITPAADWPQQKRRLFPCYPVMRPYWLAQDRPLGQMVDRGKTVPRLLWAFQRENHGPEWD